MGTCVGAGGRVFIGEGWVGGRGVCPKGNSLGNWSQGSGKDVVWGGVEVEVDLQSWTQRARRGSSHSAAKPVPRGVSIETGFSSLYKNKVFGEGK